MSMCLTQEGWGSVSSPTKQPRTNRLTELEGIQGRSSTPSRQTCYSNESGDCSGKGGGISSSSRWKASLAQGRGAFPSSLPGLPTGASPWLRLTSQETGARLMQTSARGQLGFSTQNHRTLGGECPGRGGAEGPVGEKETRGPRGRQRAVPASLRECPGRGSGRTLEK